MFLGMQLQHQPWIYRLWVTNWRAVCNFRRPFLTSFERKHHDTTNYRNPQTNRGRAHRRNVRLPHCHTLLRGGAPNYAEVGFSTYVSEAADKAGREPVSSSGIVLKMSDLPPRDGDVKDWFYQAAILEPAEGVENGSVLAGGELVYEIENVVE